MRKVNSPTSDGKDAEFDIAVSTKLNEKLVSKVDRWAQLSWRDRSKVLAAILTTVLKLVERDNDFKEDLNQVIRRLRLDPVSG